MRILAPVLVYELLAPDVRTDGQGAIVVQDELQNTYQRYR